MQIDGLSCNTSEFFGKPEAVLWKTSNTFHYKKTIVRMVNLSTSR